MRLGAIGDLIADTRRQREAPAIGQLGVEFARQAQQEVSFRAPVIGAVAWRIFDHAHAHLAEMTGAPARFAALTGMRGLSDLAPVDQAEWQVTDLHGG